MVGCDWFEGPVKVVIALIPCLLSAGGEGKKHAQTNSSLD